MLRRLALLLLVVVIPLLAFSRSAAAHNSMESSVPADGETLGAAPASVTFVFANDVPLETLTVTMTDPTGARTELTGSTLGTTARNVITPLPALADGAYGVRWRLVGEDGHAITGRVEFTVTTTGTEAVAAGAVVTTLPAVVDPAAAPSTTVVTPPTSGAADEGAWSSPDWLAWLLRYGSYAAIMLIVGVLATEAFVWRSAMDQAALRRAVSWAFGVVAVAAFAHLLLLAGDISGDAPWSSLEAIRLAADQPVGVALIARIVMAGVGWMLIVHGRPTHVYFDAGILLGIGLLGTWSFVGHARWMRWPWVGVPIDVAHHGAAAVWLGGLGIVGAAALKRLDPEETVDVMQRFSRLAAWSVLALVTTGVIQALRLVGGPSGLFDGRHGALLLAKVVGLVAMLWLASLNRQQVAARFRTSTVGRADIARMRRALQRELVVGLVIVALTASLVVSTPATAA